VVRGRRSAGKGGGQGTNGPDAELEIHPLTARRLPDLATLFGQGGDPKWCWCTFYRRSGRYWNNSTAASNRAEMEDETRRRNRRDKRAPGLIAYRGGEPVGWVSVGPRGDYERIERSKVLAPIDDKPVWSIVCFVVARQVRGQGVASALLDAAMDYAREHGATLLEAYPVDTGGERISSASVFKGTLTMFERARFEVVARRQANRTSPVRPIVRRRIRRKR
jgi:GNAT superfamily N-acetyltransferase